MGEELELFTCNSCGWARSKNYYTQQGGVKSEDDENICDICLSLPSCEECAHDDYCRVERNSPDCDFEAKEVSNDDL